MNRIMKRIYANTTFLPYKDVLSVYNQLSYEDRSLINPNNEFVDSPDLVSRNIKYIKDKPIGFAEAYKYNEKSSNTALIIVAVLEDYRNLGIGSELIRKTCNDCFSRGYTQIIYKCYKNNHKSISFAEKNGFQLINQTVDKLIYTLTNTMNQVVYTQPPYKLYPFPQYSYYPYRTYYPINTYYHNNYFNNQDDLNNQTNNLDNQNDYLDYDSNDYTSDMSGGDISFDGGDSGGE